MEASEAIAQLAGLLHGIEGVMGDGVLDEADQSPKTIVRLHPGLLTAGGGYHLGHLPAAARIRGLRLLSQAAGHMGAHLGQVGHQRLRLGKDIGIEFLQHIPPRLAAGQLHQIGGIDIAVAQGRHPGYGGGQIEGAGDRHQLGLGIQGGIDHGGRNAGGCMVPWLLGLWYWGPAP